MGEVSRLLHPIPARRAEFDLGQFKDSSHEIVVWPNEYKTGDMIYPYADAKKP